MGIQGLIPFLEKSSRPVNISQYSGCTVAIDSYCWLHKGAFSCADKLARGEKTDAYVNYCMKYVNMLLSHNIKPILVFDGRHLPAKSDTEKKRRQNREMNRKRAAELLRQDKPNEARTYLQRCVDVNHTMAVELMRQCRSRNVDCITAPYEADAQLAYLNISNIAHIVITEDSDLLLFGCSKVMFKLDLNGNGLLVEQDNLHLSMGLSKGCFSMDKFRHMCILSGCDYLPSLPKIGLAKACRFVKSTVDPDIHRALSRLGGHLNMNITVPMDYRDKFVQADAMFRHQPVFDPLTRSLVPLTPPPPGAPPPPLLSQEPLSEQQLLDLAFGNLDPFSLAKVDSWTPDNASDTISTKSSSWNLKAPHKSIWSSNFKPKALITERPDPCQVKRTPTAGKVREHKVEIPKQPTKRTFSSAQEEMNALCTQFGASPQQPSKKPRFDDEDVLNLLEKSENTPPKSETKPELLNSPQKLHVNPFSKATPPSDQLESAQKLHTNPFSKTTLPISNKFSGLSKLAQFRKTSVSETNIVQSRFFGNAQSSNKPVQDNLTSIEIKSPNQTLKDVSNTSGTESDPLDTTRVSEKLTEDSIASLMDEELDEKIIEEKQILKGKENTCSRPKHENSFKWKSSLTDMFGFQNRKLSSSPAVKNGFINPTRNESKAGLKSDGIIDETSKEPRKCRRNPFAKEMKVELPHNDSLGSQGSSVDCDSLMETSSSEISDLTPVSPQVSLNNAVTRSVPRPQVKVGLSKKHNGGFQKNLTMYAFTPKAKLKI